MKFEKSELRVLKKRMSFFRKKGYKFSFELEDIFDYSNGEIIISVFNGRLYDPKDVGVKFLRENHFFYISEIEFITERREERGEDVSNDLMYLLDYAINHYEQITDLQYCMKCHSQYAAYCRRRWPELYNELDKQIEEVRLPYGKILAEILRMPGNIQIRKEITYTHLRNELTYIHPENLLKLPALLNICENLEDILITPFLINVINGNVYELVYYKFEIEVTDSNESYYLEYNQTNSLPEEITTNIKPKAVVSKQDKKFYVDAIQKYLNSIMKMTFESEIALNPALEELNVYFRVY